LITGVITSIVGWLVWSFLVYIIGTKLLKGPETRSDWGECQRTIGFANSPGLLNILTFIPIVGGIISFAVFIWTLIASIIAIRHALDFSTGRAIITSIIGWIIYAIITFIGQMILGIGGVI
jgi:hypothetical protein